MDALAVIRKYYPHVRSVSDAKRDMVIEVTRQDTQLSTVKKHTECALAVACKRQFHATGIVVARSVTYVVQGYRAVRYLVPDNVGREITAFDRGGAFLPGIYHLKRPNQRNRLIVMRAAKRGVRGGRSKRGSRAKAMRHWTQGIREVMHAKAKA